jgi:hypothetical protein
MRWMTWRATSGRPWARVSAAGAMALVGSFVVVSARVALLNTIFWAVMNSVFVVGFRV